MVINVPQVTDRQIRHIMRSLHTANLMDRKNIIKQCNKQYWCTAQLTSTYTVEAAYYDHFGTRAFW